TTLMGHVDAALGIKAGINFNGYKNRLGSFEPPLAVLLDKSFLRTLPHRHLLNGLCEIIKLAVIRDAALFAALEAQAAASVAAHFQNAESDVILDGAIAGMLEELAPNLYEEELARKVDFGHTFSYGLEALHARHLLHGEAVLLDILVSVVIAGHRGLLAARATARIFALVERLDIGLDFGLLDGAAMWNSLIDRVAHRNGLQRVPLPTAIGQCTFVDDITRAELDAALAALRARIPVSHEPALER
ncbi:MAG: 2-epi-5-epi-valiolone synthase, partial [Proteobacteria bacterium]|nr:2-epi-5-epi-valiolone synthase [Pseudomonadota bacterium]